MNIIDRSATSIAVAFNYPVSKAVAQPFSAYVNDEKVGETAVPSYSFTNLAPETNYRLQLKNSELDQSCQASTTSTSLILNVKSFNAKGDGHTNDTLAIQSAIAFAPEHSVITFPAGTYLIT